jgi:N-acetylmuramoyl-L-alanine amidase
VTALRRLLLAVLLAASPAIAVDVGGTSVATRTFGRTECVPLDAVARALNGRFWRVADRFIAIFPGDSGGPGREYVFRADSTAAYCDRQRVALPVAPVFDSNRLYLPVAALPVLFPKTRTPIVHALDVDARGDTLTFTVSVVDSPPGGRPYCFGHSRSTLEYRLSFAAGHDSAFLSEAALLGLTPPGVLKSVTVEKSAGTVLYFTFRQPSSAKLLARADGAELRVWPRPVRRIARIVLDPGHGGGDPGAVGRKGTREKIINMGLALRIKKKLAAQGFDVILTRDTDEFVSLADRSKCGNGRKADLFVSIHTNSSPNRAACGLETYFLSEAKTDWERAVAARENASLETGDSGSGPGMAGDVGLILADLAQSEFLMESSELAACIQEATVPVARIKDRGVQQANFYVLRNNYMPAVLVECGFLSNKSEEKLLRQGTHWDKLAEGIYRGILEFAKRYGGSGSGQRTENK